MLLTEFYDTTYPNQGIYTSRVTCRALVKNEQGLLGYIHIKGEDLFGVRDHFESAGGGIEASETREEAMHREIMEELGYHCTIDAYLGMVINRYNLIGQLCAHHYYCVTLTTPGALHRTEFEAQVFAGVVWKTASEWLETLGRPTDGVNQMIHERERFMLEHYLKTI